jgi:anti-anti-sigma factor
MGDQTFHVKLERQDDAWIVVCGGELDGASAWHLSDSVELCLDNKPSSVLMDCSDVTFVDSGGLWALLRAAREAHARSVEYRVALSDQIRDVVRKAGMLDRMLAGPGSMAVTPG